MTQGLTCIPQGLRAHDQEILVTSSQLQSSLGLGECLSEYHGFTCAYQLCS